MINNMLSIQCFIRTTFAFVVSISVQRAEEKPFEIKIFIVIGDVNINFVCIN